MALNDQAGKPRRATRNFASLRATFSRSANPVTELEQKPAPKPVNVEIKPTPVALASNIDRRQNRMSLFDMFSKPRVERARGYGNEPGLEPLPERPQTPAHFKPEKPLPQQPVESISQSRSTSRLSGSTLASSQRYAPSISPRPVDDWDPPPLFQAYPQSARHGTLLGTNLSADVIRGQQMRRQNAGLFGSTTSLPFVAEDQTSQHEQSWQALGLIPAVWEGPELVSKVFVLVTAGRLVQYAGDGNYDRMPEKVLQLGEKSAAFACDLIPGKHWVVQVLQSANGEGLTTINKSRSLLSRLRMPSSAMRKTASSFLLIFSSAEEMDLWLKAIRKMIQQISGKDDEVEAETKHSRKNTAEKLDDLPTHRFQLQKSPVEAPESGARSSSPLSQAHSIHSSTRPQTMSARGSTHSTEHDSPRHSASDTDGNSSRPQRGTSTEASSLATTPASIDQMRLDRLRDSSRHSIISVRTSHTSATDTTTVPTSRCSSSPPSPHVETFAPRQPSPPRPPPIRTSYIQPISIAGNYRRLMQTNQVDGSERIVRIQRQSPTDVHDLTSPILYAKATPVPSTILENPRSRGPPIYPRGVLNRQQNSEIEPRTRTQRPDSTVGQLPIISNRSMSRIDQPRRQLFRPLPIRPSEPASGVQSRAPEAYVPRRFSSLPTSGPSPPALPAGPPAVSTTRPRAPSYSLTPPFQPQGPLPSAPQVKRLQRPTSLQIRSDPAPFLSSSRSRQPSISRSQSASPAPSTFYLPASPPPIPPMNPSRPNLLSRTQLMVPGLPPPAPPPNCPLPAPPPQNGA
jgi:hypothetical protein